MTHPARSPVYSVPMLPGIGRTESDEERLIREVRDEFPNPNANVEGFFEEREKHKADRFEDWAFKHRKLRDRRPDMMDSAGWVMPETPEEFKLPDGD